MEAWTDGTTHVFTGSAVGLYVFDGNRKRLENLDIAHEWKTLLAVDVEADLVWTGSPAACYRLSDLSLIEEVPGLTRAASIGGGQIAAIFGQGRGVPAEFKIGVPGAWHFETTLGPYESGRQGVSQVSEEPAARYVGRDPYVTANEFGIVVTDGQTGLVLKFDTTGQMEEPWLSGGVVETELFGYATADGVVVTARHAARHSSSYLLTGDHVLIIGEEYGSKSVATWSHIFLVGHGWQVFDSERKHIASKDSVEGFVTATAAAGNVAVAAGDGFAYIFTVNGSEVIVESVMTAELYVLTVDFSTTDKEILDGLRKKHGISGYSSSSGTVSTTMTVKGLDKETAEQFAAAFEPEDVVDSARAEPFSVPPGLSSVHPRFRGLVEAAEEGDPIAMRQLAQALVLSDAREPNADPLRDEGPNYWLEKAALAGDLASIKVLVERSDDANDATASRRWVEVGVDHNHVASVVRLAEELRSETAGPDGTDLSDARTFEIVRRAADHDVVELSALAHHYYATGKTDDGTDDCAWACFSGVVDRGQVRFANWLGIIRYYQDRKDVGDGDDALHWYRRSAEAGSELAHHNYGEVREEQGQLDGDDGALAWYRRGAAMGDDLSASALARLEAT